MARIRLSRCIKSGLESNPGADSKTQAERPSPSFSEAFAHARPCVCTRVSSSVAFVQRKAPIQKIHRHLRTTPNMKPKNFPPSRLGSWCHCVWHLSQGVPKGSTCKLPGPSLLTLPTLARTWLPAMSGRRAKAACHWTG